MDYPEMMHIPLDELRKKNDALWMFVLLYLPFATGNLDRYLDIAMEAHRYRYPKEPNETGIEPARIGKNVVKLKPSSE